MQFGNWKVSTNTIDFDNGSEQYIVSPINETSLGEAREIAPGVFVSDWIADTSGKKGIEIQDLRDLQSAISFASGRDGFSLDPVLLSNTEIFISRQAQD
jgi:hypothetical protein